MEKLDDIDSDLILPIYSRYQTAKDEEVQLEKMTYLDDGKVFVVEASSEKPAIKKPEIQTYENGGYVYTEDKKHDIQTS